jgi:C4-dicarboxylate transporter DctM subunit
MGDVDVAHYVVPHDTENMAMTVGNSRSEASVLSGSPVSAASRPVRKPKRSSIAFLISITVLVGSLVGMFLPVDDEVVGGLALVLMVAMLFLRFPVWLSLLLPALVAMFEVRGWRLVESSLSTTPYNAIASWTFTVIPMFVFMGLLISDAGIAKDIFVAMKKWLGWLPGGYAVGTNLAGAGLASVSGSTVSTTYTLARVSVPEMLRAGYDRRYAETAVMVCGLTGNLIPPSILLVIYAGIAETPVGPQLLAGVGPGLVLALMLSAVMAFAAWRFPKLAPGAVAVSEDEPGRIRSIVRIWPVPAVVILTVWGMFSGVFTATEVASAGAFLVLLASIWYRRKDRPWAAVKSAAIGTVSATGMMMLILVSVTILSTMLSVTGVGRLLVDSVTGLEMGRVAFLLVLVVFYIILGTFMDTFAMMVVTVPLLLPVLELQGVDLLWFGVFVVFLGEIGMITPPVGMVTYLVHGLMQDPEVNQGHSVSMRDTFSAVLWVMPIAVAFCVILIFFPDLTQLFVGDSQ